MSLGSNIQKYRKIAKLTQKELGKLIGVGNTTISSWEKDITEPNVNMIEALCGVLNVSPNMLLASEAQKKAPAEAEEIGFDDFSYAMFGEAKELTEENKEKLLEMARFFAEQQKRKAADELNSYLAHM